MDSSRRAVESYWRSRMIDGATSDEDKVTPVYKLEEICELLRSSHVSIVKEVSEFILKRLDHKSPVVKQKALRLIKYAVGKSGVEFRREMQRHSTAVRQLLHYKGHPDPLKGDALNKSVRDIAQDAISAIFASDDNKPAPAEDLNKRIQGFGNTNYEMPSSDDKKSFFSEVVGIGSASIKQGLNHIAAAHSLKKNDNGSYRSPNLRRSLTTERDPDRYETVEHHSESRSSSSSSGISKNVPTGTWGQDSRVNITETTNGVSGSSYSGSKSREEKLLETIVTSGGVRLQPTRDALQIFLVEASKLDAVALSHAVESKLQSHLWQVRMKAVCVLESILRKKDDEHFAIIASYFSENRDSVVKCAESPQASLREKANKVLSFLDDEQTTGSKSYPENESRVKAETVPVQMPDLIDTGGPDDYYGNEDFTQKQSDNIADMVTSVTPVTDLFGDSLITGLSTSEHKNEDDPFADVSFHTTEDREQVDDLFSGLTVDNKQTTTAVYTLANKNTPELVDIFSSSSEQVLPEATVKQDMNNLMADLSIKGNVQEMNQQGSTFSDLMTQQSQPVSNDALNGIFDSQMNGMNVNPNALFPLGAMQYSMPPNMMFNPAFASQQINYGVMGSFLAQQQLLATMSNFQQLGNLNALGNADLGHPAGNSRDGGYTPPLPDIFNPNIPTQNRSTILNNPKKEETKAFDFISDHLSAARDPKRVV